MAKKANKRRIKGLALVFCLPVMLLIKSCELLFVAPTKAAIRAGRTRRAK